MARRSSFWTRALVGTIVLAGVGSGAVSPIGADVASEARSAPPATADAVPFVGTFGVECTMGNPSPGGVCDHHHSYTGAVDLDLPVGTPARAAGPGTVVFVNKTCANGDTGCEGGAGRWVGVQHADGKVSRYLHLNTVSVTVGQVVARGGVVGTTGTTGNAFSNPHLHYDEQKPMGTRDHIGPMYACHGSALVVYPDITGYDEWEDVPYGTMLRNDGYGCFGDLFVDVGAGHPFFADISWMAAEGLTNGYADGTFRPLEIVTRQAVSAWLHRLAGAPPGPFADPGFADVGAGHAFATEIWWMAATERSTGYADGTYRPTACVTRQAMAAFLYREAGGQNAPPGPTFSDVGPSHPFLAEITWMSGMGITNGYPDGTFRPAECVTRQAAAAFLHRLFL